MHNSNPGKGNQLVPLASDRWWEPVDGEELLDDIVSTCRKFLAAPPWALEVMALWAVGTHVFDTAEVFPRLVFTSPLPECGKTLALKLLNGISRKALLTANMTPAVIFRLIDKEQATLLLDEADTFIDGDFIGLINSGHSRASAAFGRCEGDRYTPRTFSTWAPMVIAKIGEITWPALRSRSIEIRMHRARPGEIEERFRDQRHTPLLNELGRRAAQWAQQNLEKLRDADAQMPPQLGNRAADNWRFLFAIADKVRGHWPETARKAALALSRTVEPAPAEQLLDAIWVVLNHSDASRFPSDELRRAIGEVDDQYKGLSAPILARRLKPFGIAPAALRIGDRVLRGYRREDFEDAFASYLPHRSATVQQSRDLNDLDDDGSAT